MDSAVVNSLARVLDDAGNQLINSDTAKSQIAGILSGKSPAEVLEELDAYVSSIPGREKGKTVLIVIMALLRHCLNSGPTLAREINERGYALVGHLHGGLTMLLKGKSQTFTFRLSVLDREAKNAYAEVDWWNDRFFWPHIDLFLAAELLHRLAPDRFERLALEDPNNVLLLSMAQQHLPISPSDGLLQELLKGGDPFHPNFALAFYSRPISILCDRIWNKNKKRGDIKELDRYVARLLTAFEQCSPGLQAELLTNYFLVHHWAFPTALARRLVGAELQGEFVRQIAEPGKIRTIRELSAVAELIAKTPACNEQKHRISKKPLVHAVRNVLTRFVRERTGIYAGDRRWLDDAKAVLQLLTPRQRKRFGFFLEAQKEALMTSPLDRLVRFDICVKDALQHDIIQGLQGCLAHSP